MENSQNPGIKIVKDGPYLVSGPIEITEQTINSVRNDYTMIPGQTFPTEDSVSLCRCGQSGTAPFCDGSHVQCSFNGTETASRKPYRDRAMVIKGPDLILADVEEYCSFSRFCHTVEGNAWELTEDSDIPSSRENAVKAASECPSGRLVAYDKLTKQPIEIAYKPSIGVLQDPQRGVSGPLWVKGNIPVESADGEIYEVRNRITLCRCGKSKNKPYCDASHVSSRFKANKG